MILLKSWRVIAIDRGAESRAARYNRVMSPLRIAGFVLIAMSALFGIASIYYEMIGESSNLSMYDVWFKFLPASLNWVQRSLWSSLWTGLYTILVMPAWMVSAVAGVICIDLGRRQVQ